MRNDYLLRTGNNTIGYDAYEGQIFPGSTTGKFSRNDTVGVQMKRIRDEGSIYTVDKNFNNGRFVGPLRIIEDAERFSVIVLITVRVLCFQTLEKGNFYLIEKVLLI